MAEDLSREGTDRGLDHVDRSAVMLCIILLAMVAGVIGFGFGFLLAELIK